MNCPYCGFHFKAFVANAGKDRIPDMVPIVCESCAEVGLVERGKPRKLTADELEQLKESPAWKDFIEPALAIINEERAKRS